MDLFPALFQGAYYKEYSIETRPFEIKLGLAEKKKTQKRNREKLWLKSLT